MCISEWRQNVNVKTSTVVFRFVYNSLNGTTTAHVCTHTNERKTRVCGRSNILCQSETVADSYYRRQPNVYVGQLLVGVFTHNPFMPFYSNLIYFDIQK